MKLLFSIAFLFALPAFGEVESVTHHGRETKFAIYYPSSGEVKGVAVAAHNWGGHFCDGVADPSVVAETLNIVFVCVEYYQSGWTLKDGPYDFGVKASQDVIAVTRLLRARIASTRWYLVGASGGGHVALMAYRLQPTWFQKVVLLCPLTRLTPDIAMGLKGGSPLTAKWPSLPEKERLQRDMTRRSVWRDIRKRGGIAAIKIVHGGEDHVAPVRGVAKLADSANSEGFAVKLEWVEGQGHALDMRTDRVISELSE